MGLYTLNHERCEAVSGFLIVFNIMNMEGCMLWWICVLFSMSHITTSTAMAYVDYDIASDRVCSRLGKRELSISITRPLLVREGGRLLSNWPGVHSFTCRWEIEAKGRGLGVVAVIQKLKFRKLGIECVDYLQTTNTTIYHKSSAISISGGGKKFKIKKKKKKEKGTIKSISKTVGKAVEGFKEERDANRGPRLCGSMLFGLYLGINDSLPPPPTSPLPPLPPTTPSTPLSILSTFFKGAINPWSTIVSRGAIVDPKGELKTYIYVANRAIRSDETLELVIAYSGYQACDGKNHLSSLFHCGYGLCISRSLVNDGVVNCPFGDCIDEGSCNDAKASNLTARILGHSTARRTSGGVPAGVTATSSFFAIAILITIGACICFILRRNKKRREAQDATVVVSYPQQSGNGEYVGVPTSTGMQSIGPQGEPLDGQRMMPPNMPSGSPAPTMMPPPGQPPQGGGNIGFCIPGAGTPFSPMGTPYPGAGAPYPPVGTPYPPSGNAPYPSGNTPYPVQPPPVQPPSSGNDASAPTAPASQELPPPYTSLFPQQQM